MRKNKLNIKDILIGVGIGIVIILVISLIQKGNNPRQNNNEPSAQEVIEKNKQEKKKFLDKVQRVYHTAHSKFISERVYGEKVERYYSSKDNELNLDDVKYFVRIDGDGNIVQLVVNDENYKLIIGSSAADIPVKLDEIDTKYIPVRFDGTTSSVIGDVNGNGYLDMNDINIILTSPQSVNNDIGDINNDGKVDKTDADEIQFIINKDRLIGDVNNDGKVDDTDTKIVDNYIDKKEELKEEDKVVADVNNDGKVDNSDREEIKNVSSNNEVKFIVRHFKQNIADDIEDEEHYTLAESDYYNEKALSTVVPDTKNYVGFTSPNKQKVVVLSNGNTVVNYYYKRNQYKFTLYTETSYNRVSYTRTFSNNEGHLGMVVGARGVAQTYPYKLFETNLYYDEEITINYETDNDIYWVNDSDILGDSHSFKFKMGTNDITYRVMRQPITYEVGTSNANLCNSTERTPSYSGAYVADKYVYTICMGKKNTGGYSVEVENVNINGGNVIVDVVYKSPGNSCATTQALTNPGVTISFNKKPDTFKLNSRSETKECN